MSGRTLDPALCPLCGETNACGLAEGQGPCWCGTDQVSREILDLMAERGLDGACLCRRCLVGRVPSPCVGVCALDEAGSTCVGCRRTLDEVRIWSRASPRERAEILLRVLLAGRGATGC